MKFTFSRSATERSFSKWDLNAQINLVGHYLLKYVRYSLARCLLLNTAIKCGLSV